MTPDLKVLKREARHKATSAQRLLELAALDPRLSRTVAGGKHTPLPVLEALARSSDMPTRRAVAANAQATPALLARLSQDRQWTVLKAVAAHPQTDAATLERLSTHSRQTVKTALLERPRLSAKLLETLGRDPDFMVRLEVARYAAVPTPLLQQLFADEHILVRSAAVEHDALPTEQKRQALADPEAEVRMAALRALAELSPQAGGVMEAELRHAARDPEPEVRRGVAVLLGRRDAPFQKSWPDSSAQAIADTLLRDAVDLVRIVAARRADPALLPELLPLLEKELAQGGYGASELGQTLMARCIDPALTSMLLERGDSWLLNRVAESAIDPAVYAALLEDPEHRDYLPRNAHIPDAFWVGVGERILADPERHLPLLPLIKRVLSPGEGGPRPDLFRWFAAHLGALLALVPHFAREERHWRSFDLSEVRQIVYGYATEADVSDLALGLISRLKLYLPQGETP